MGAPRSGTGHGPARRLPLSAEQPWSATSRAYKQPPEAKAKPGLPPARHELAPRDLALLPGAPVAHEQERDGVGRDRAVRLRARPGHRRPAVLDRDPVAG